MTAEEQKIWCKLWKQLNQIVKNKKMEQIKIKDYIIQETENGLAITYIGTPDKVIVVIPSSGNKVKIETLNPQSQTT